MGQGDKKRVDKLLEQFKKGKQPYNPTVIAFTGVEDLDVYNITAPFLDDNQWVIAGRVEPRDSEHSKVMFFVEDESGWKMQDKLPVFTMQDPFVTSIQGELVLGGVEIFHHPDNKKNLWWQTRFYRGKNIKALKPFAMGPKGMKDIRLIDLEDGRVGVFTRPQGEKGGRGTIGFTTICSLDELTEEVINSAPLLDQFHEDEWGGVNEAHLLTNGTIGVLGHIAKFSDGDIRHYYPMIFTLDPSNYQFTSIEIISERKNFKEGPSKRPDLMDVVFSGGLIRHDDGTVTVYAGISDAGAQSINMEDPFCKYE